MEQRVSLYADDLLLYIYDPGLSYINICQFHDISGYKLNLQKSELFPVNKAAHQYSFSSLPFKETEFVHLGISVTANFSKLFAANFLPLIAPTELSLKRWMPLPLSIAGRINSIRMNILPKFTYLFQCIPVFIPKLIFCRLDSTFSSFIWSGKAPPNIKQHPTSPKVSWRHCSTRVSVLLLGI